VYRKAISIPRILPCRKRASLEPSAIILTLSAVGVSTRKISHFLEDIYRAFHSSQTKHPSAHPSYCRTSESLAGKAPKRGVLPGVWDRTFLSIRRGKTPKERVYMASGIKPNGQRETLGFWLFGAEGESARNWEEVLKKRRGGPKVRIFLTDDLPGLDEAIKRIFPKWRPPCRAGCAEQSTEKRAKSAGKPRLMLFELPCVILSPFAATSIPRTNCSGCQQRDKEATQVVEMCCRKRAVGLEPAG